MSEATIRPDSTGQMPVAVDTVLSGTGKAAVERGARPPSYVRAARYLAQPRWWLKIVLLGSLYAVYSAIRNMVGEVTGEAFANGRAIDEVERRWHVAVEEPLNGWVHHTPWVADPSAVEYASLHFVVTPRADDSRWREVMHPPGGDRGRDPRRMVVS